MNVRLILLLSVIASSAIAGPPLTQPLTVTVQGDGMVTSNPAGILCPDDCNEVYSKGTTVYLTASADSNGAFLRWEGACTGTVPTCQLKMAAARSVVAVFEGASTPYPISLAATGQTSCWDAIGALVECAGTGQDGDLRKGTPHPAQRFTDNQDGTVTDNLTGLTWLQNALCLGGLWTAALQQANALAHGQCGLTDNSAPGHWRLPNINELQSLLDYENGGWPAGHPFTNAPTNRYYWSSTTDRHHPNTAWVVNNGNIVIGNERIRLDKTLVSAGGLAVKGP